MATLFDVYIAIDWSSVNKRSKAQPSTDAIWVGEKLAGNEIDPTVVSETYWRTRLDCRTYVCNRLLHHLDQRRRVFVGFDFAYGYPKGFASALGLVGYVPPWRLVWDDLASRIEDDETNRNNRFEAAAEMNSSCGGPRPGPFWGCPVGRALPSLSATSPEYPYFVRSGLSLNRLRRVEERQRNAQETWKLYGAGSVGGQILVGLPVVRELRDDPRLAEFSNVWPFETGFTLEPTPEQGPFILHVEIFPSNVPEPLDPDLTIKDQAQVRAVVRWLSSLDDDGQLGALFAAPSGLSKEELDSCINEEGWIIGSG